jgi:hypothetical protein
MSNEALPLDRAQARREQLERKLKKSPARRYGTMIAYHPQREIVFDPDQDLIKKPAQKADYREKSLNHVGAPKAGCRKPTWVNAGAGSRASW